ncbi:hypothetical protein C8J57DRAFT_1614367 [Mycena rebaudengoi]|nr:hypothetical protein C8J57DRAFT_1614367 [Mycena rebaudengoi]
MLLEILSLTLTTTSIQTARTSAIVSCPPLPTVINFSQPYSPTNVFLRNYPPPSIHPARVRSPNGADGSRAPSHVALIARLETQITEALAREAQLRARAAEEGRCAVGAFPTLGATTSHPSAASAAPQTRTVRSLNSKAKKVTVSSLSTPVFVLARPLPLGVARTVEFNRREVNERASGVHNILFFLLTGLRPSFNGLLGERHL